jgi:hypothetical protein
VIGYKRCVREDGNQFWGQGWFNAHHVSALEREELKLKEYKIDE